MPGPAPKPKGQRRHRNVTPGFVQLDPTECTEAAPEWPLQPNAVEAIRKLEEARWEELWRLPQAREWIRMRCYNMVALYTRLEVHVMNDMPDPRVISELRQIDATIGVSPKAMMGLRWEIPLEPKAEPSADEMRGKLHAVGQRAYVPAG